MHRSRGHDRPTAAVDVHPSHAERDAATRLGRTMTPVAEWRVDLPLTRPLSMNDREHYMVKARRVASLRHAVKLLVRTKQIPTYPHVEIELHYTPRDARRRDRTNLVATLKACEDGIVDAGVVPDDTPQYVTSAMPIIDPPVKARHGHLYLLIRPAAQ